MHLRDGELVLSATDLSSFLACRHRTALDMGVAYGDRNKPRQYDDPLLDILWKRGLEHERRYVESLRAEGKSIAELGNGRNPDERVARTLAAMREGRDIIVQGALSDGHWLGYPDIMRRVEASSSLGSWSYEIADTKLARETRAGTVLQLCLYSEMLAVAQGSSPENFYVVTPEADIRVHPYRLDDYVAYFRLIRDQMLEIVALPHLTIAGNYYPEPVDHCEVCRWIGQCKARRRQDDHLSLVAGISRIQRRELESRAVTTLTALAGLRIPLEPKPRRGSMETYVRVREQARLQFESRGKKPPLHELLSVEPEKGLCRLPEPSPGDLFIDLEGDPFAAEGGREYLFGVVRANGSYEAKWGFTAQAEREAFEWVMDLIDQTARQHPGMHVYHYATYEVSAFKRLMGRYATREQELDSMLRAGRFIDLYAVVRHGLRAGVERYSIKNMEELYGFDRDVELPDANRNLSLLQQGLELGRPDSIPSGVRKVVEGYNRDDCVSTLRLRAWLEVLRAGLVSDGKDVPRPALVDGAASDEIDEKAKIVRDLRARLLVGVPEDRSERNDEQQGRWLLAYMLDYHRREARASWWEYFRLRELPENELFDEHEAVAGLEFVERVDFVVHKRTGKATGSVFDRYRYPAQEMEIERGSDARLQSGTTLGKITAVDRARLTIDIKKGPANAAVHPTAVFAFKHIGCDAMEDALLRIGECVAMGGDSFATARALIARKKPRLATGEFGVRADESPSECALRIVADLDQTVLPIQGPPGAGKTFCGGKMICQLVAQGKRVGVTATSHKVIRNLLDEVAKHASEADAPIRLGHKCDEEPGEISEVSVYGNNESAWEALESGAVNVLGGTAWCWSPSEAANIVDVLFVDEAGQMALANVVAVSQAANSLVLLGDPQQLEQPRKGSHPEGVDVSALEHILGTRQTMPDDRGLFLAETWRLAPKICKFTSELFYERRLHPHKGMELQRVTGVEGFPESGLALVPVAHDENRNHSPEEIEVVAGLIARLTKAGARWIDADGQAQPLTGAEILVVSPYNAQVRRLADRLADTGARVGTVDKFQGQEAPVVIYSMAASSPEDAPRGMEFLYSLNRLNVATSRARCLAVIVASPHLFAPECNSPGEMRLANALCRFREIVMESARSS